MCMCVCVHVCVYVCVRICMYHLPFLIQFKDFFDNLVNADGIWLDMNEAANFCDGLCSTAAEIEVKYPFMLNGKDATMMGRSPNFNANNPPYAINNRCYKVPLYTRTLAMDAVYHGDVLEYDAHNLYGEWLR